MSGNHYRFGSSARLTRGLIAMLCITLLVPGDSLQLQAQDQPQTGSAAPETVKVSNEQLDSLVAPIALYPDPLLTQTLIASTYPLEIIQLQQWLQKNPNLKDKALADAVQKQDWDPSIQAMATFPDVVKQLAENVKWSTDLGNAFLAQQGDVMDAVQRMRAKAKDKGNLKTTEQQVVETRVVENKSVIIVEQADPEVVYVPSYNPTVVYGAPAYPYPPIAYPPPGYYAAGMALSFGLGVAMGAAWGGGWGWNSGWGSNNNITVNRNNNYVSNYNRQSANRVSNRQGNGNNWQHNPKHRGGAPYSDRSTANRFGGSTRGDLAGNRQGTRRDNQGRVGDRQAGAGDRGRPGGRQEASGANRGSMADRSGGRNDFYNRGASDARNRGGSGDRVGNQRVSGGGDRGSRSNTFGGSSGRGGGGSFSGGSTRASSARGSSSMGSRGGGGFRGGGRRR